jgi:trimeric autotransporter adhesin
MTIGVAAVIAGLMLAPAAHPVRAASDLEGRVLFSGLPVPGATISASLGDRRHTAFSDVAGAFRFAGLDDGVWALRVEMRGFVAIARDVALPYTGPPLAWELAMRPYAEIVGRRSAPLAAAVALVPLDTTATDVDFINGSVSNGAATPFAQSPAFGNNRQQGRARYSGGLGVVFGNSSWNAAPYSFGGDGIVPSYGDVQASATLIGPLRIPGVIRNGPQIMIAYQHGRTHNATTQSARMPGEAARTGDLSEVVAPIRDPLTGVPFPGNVIPLDRISPQTAALLGYYPLPNTLTSRGANFEAPIVSKTTQDILQVATNRNLNVRTTLGVSVAYQRSAVDTVSLFDFTDRSRQSSLDAVVNISKRISPRLSMRGRYQFGRLWSNVTPFFSGRADVSGDAGISGNSRNPVNWGPPSLSFPDIAGLRDVDYQQSIRHTHFGLWEASIRRGRHNITAGADVRSTGYDTATQSDPRGTLGFTGDATGDPFADFLLGIPATSTIGFREPVIRLRAIAYDGYLSDDWRVGTFTVNLGARYEYESPFDSGLNPDCRGLEPRLAASWRPIPASSLVLRASYGVYRNLGVYQPLAVLLAQQPPFARTFSVSNSRDTPLTLASPFPAAIPSRAVFTVDPQFRVGFAQNWQVSAQRDLPGSLTLVASYLGTKGSRLMQASVPNTYPQGAENPCASCPAGFVHVTSGGASLRNAAQLIVRRRLHNGLMASAQYTFAKATDDAATFSNAAVSPQALSIAQDWRDLHAEQGPSAFDQRHVLSVQFQFTSGAGDATTLAPGVWKALAKDWTITSQLTAGTGLPFTPVYFARIGDTGFVGSRPSLTGLPVAPATEGSYANAAAYAVPAAGEWGNAGRNSIRGPRQFSLDASLTRAIPLRGRMSLEARVSATNVLNRVTFAAIETVITHPLFGQPTIANPMRRLQAALRMRF